MNPTSEKQVLRWPGVPHGRGGYRGHDSGELQSAESTPKPNDPEATTSAGRDRIQERLNAARFARRHDLAETSAFCILGMAAVIALGLAMRGTARFPDTIQSVTTRLSSPLTPLVPELADPAVNGSTNLADRQSRPTRPEANTPRRIPSVEPDSARSRDPEVPG